MQSVELNVSKRDGGTPAKVLRRDGIVPGVFYGAGSSTVAVEVDAQRAVFAGDADGGGADIGFEGANAVAVAVSEVDFVLPGAQLGVVKIQIEPVETQGVVVGDG